jgi:predicted transcriptional regulator
MKKIRSVKIDDYLWEELEEVAKMVKATKSSLIRAAIIEKITRIKMGK